MIGQVIGILLVVAITLSTLVLLYLKRFQKTIEEEVEISRNELFLAALKSEEIPLGKIDKLAKKFFEEAFKLKNVDYVDAELFFRKKNKATEIEFCEMITKMLYSGEDVKKVQLEELKDKFRKIIESNLIVGQKEGPIIKKQPPKKTVKKIPSELDKINLSSTEPVKKSFFTQNEKKQKDLKSHAKKRKEILTILHKELKESLKEPKKIEISKEEKEDESVKEELITKKLVSPLKEDSSKKEMSPNKERYEFPKKLEQYGDLSRIHDGKQHKIFLINVYGANKKETIEKLGIVSKNKGEKVAIIALNAKTSQEKKELNQISTENKFELFLDSDEKDLRRNWKNFETRVKEYDLIIISCSSESNLDEDLLKEINYLEKDINPNETILIIPDEMGEIAKIQTLEFKDTVKSKGSVITLTASVAKKGGVLYSCSQVPRGMYFITIGKEIVDKDEFNLKGYASLLLGHGDLSLLIDKIKLISSKNKNVF